MDPKINVIINDFKKRKPKSVFINLDITTFKFVNSITDRVKSPYMINQGNTYLCGPNAFLCAVCKKEPELYVKYMLDLWEFGKANLRSLTVQPSKSCREAKVSPNTIHPTDWIGLASLRDSENLMLHFDEPLDGAAGITFPGDLSSWFMKINPNSIQNKTNSVSNASIENLIQADRAFSSNKIVCLFINSKRTKNDSAFRSISANHWVVLHSGIMLNGKRLYKYTNEEAQKLKEGKVTVFVTTWGHEKYALHNKLESKRENLSLGSFINYYFGFVSS